MAGPTTSRTIGCATRIYKNSDNKIIAIDEISVVADNRRLSNGTWFPSTTLSSKRILFHLSTGNRIVSLIQMIGDYSSVTENSGNYLNAIWNNPDGTENSQINFNGLAKIGDLV